MSLPPIEDFWQFAGFVPNAEQDAAIRHRDGPLYLPAGPGSGKTRVLLWRTFNLIVYQGVLPEQIYLSTFTEKAAFQLQEGLQALLGLVTTRTNRAFDLGRMYVGTVHSLCRRILDDRQFMAEGRPPRVRLMDDLSQYFYLTHTGNWARIAQAAETDPQTIVAEINSLFINRPSESRHEAVTNTIAFINRLAEENLDTVEAYVRATASQTTPAAVVTLIALADAYRASLRGRAVPFTDFSLLQINALERLMRSNDAASVFQHVIVDEYQDTNPIQEEIFFRLAQGTRNFCVVGDDDQALYRFRGATVENFVQFPVRCSERLGVAPAEIPLTTNYRSREGIVRFYNAFMGEGGWRTKTGVYRVEKEIQAQRGDPNPAVVASKGDPEAVYPEIARLCVQLLAEGKVQDPNQIAFLFPSLKSVQAQRAIQALEEVGLRPYAPRAGRFLEVEEALDIFGLFAQVFGRPFPEGDVRGRDYGDFIMWLETIETRGIFLLRRDAQLAAFVADKRVELQQSAADCSLLSAVALEQRWDLKAPYDIARMKRAFLAVPGLSDHARRALASRVFERAIEMRIRRDQPRLSLGYAIQRATTIDWGILDLFYRFLGFGHFRALLDLAEQGEDEGPICNLGLISQYLARFMDEYLAFIPPDRLADGSFARLFFSSFLYTLFRRGESEYEDADDPFPRGRIPFLTIHQAKGLEFPVVVLGNLYKKALQPQPIETLIRPLINRPAEPLELVPQFDAMRMFYVALSRAKNLLVLANLTGAGRATSPAFKATLNNGLVRPLAELEIASIPAAADDDPDVPANYSFTGDYLNYQKCPRQYMIFNKYGFTASRTQTMLFGSLVHRTLEDLHQHLIRQREGQA